MKKLFSILTILIFSTWNVNAAPPTRAFTYVSNTTIDPAQVNTNENSLYSYLQTGVDTYASGSITGAAVSASASIPYVSLSLSNSIVNADISTSAAITASKITAGYGVLPSGAVYFMLTGSCPTGTTDVSATYSNLFLRVNAIAGSTGGADTHTHTSGSYAVSGTTSAPTTGGDAAGSGASGSNATHVHTYSANVTGTSASGNNVPAYVTAKLCQIN